MKTEIKVQLFIGVLMAMATIAAAIITATWTAGEVANEQATSIATAVAKQEIEEAAPSLKLFPSINTRSRTTQKLGDWQACVLVVAGESHAKQACTCLIEPNEENDSELLSKLFTLPVVLNGAAMRRSETCQSCKSFAV